MILVIDITLLDKLILILFDDLRIVHQKIYRGQRQNLLLRIDQFLKGAKSSLGKLDGIALIEGGGSFSTVRQAVAVLNTMALVQGLPVAGFDRRRSDSDQSLLAAIAAFFEHQLGVKFLKPIYSGQPNIMKHVT